jgi:glycosyltransferase involved in cell wall biosynthesis
LGQNRKLTIAHFLRWSTIGGGEISTLLLTKSTRDRFRHIVFCIQEGTALRDLFQQHGIETATYVAPTPSLRHAGRYWNESRALARQLRSFETDLTHFADEHAAHSTSLGAFLAGTKRVCHIRTLSPSVSLRYWITLLPIQSYIFVSNAAKRSFAYSIPEGKARVIYNTIEIPVVSPTEYQEVRKELGIPLNATVVGMVARVTPAKDFDTFLAAATDVLQRHPDVRFLIVGDRGSIDLNRRHYEKVCRKLRELGIADKFIFTGQRNDVPRLIQTMDVTVLCSHREGFGRCVAEAMALRKPVIGTEVGGIPEIIEDCVTGFLHEHGNSRELGNKITFLIENPEAAKRLGLAGYDHVRSSLNVEKFATEISRAYDDLVLA